MQKLNTLQTQQISAGIKFKFNIGEVLGTTALAFITGGPVGAGLVLGAMIVSNGVNNLNDMHNDGNFPNMHDVKNIFGRQR